MYHLAVSGDAVIASIATIIVAAIGAGALIITSRRSGRTEKNTEQIAAVSQQIATEMQPNGGSTFRDAIDRLDRRSTAHDERFGRLEASNDRLVKSNDQLVRGQADLIKIMQRIERRQLGEEDVVETDPT